ncbi:hypothetical protein DER44DRAFT_245073 [Fusarium oxysporum]|nr:hypothetical protein DER44DRAFT_245073 [Fusarium oxysporum]
MVGFCHWFYCFFAVWGLRHVQGRIPRQNEAIVREASLKNNMNTCKKWLSSDICYVVLANSCWWCKMSYLLV